MYNESVCEKNALLFCIGVAMLVNLSDVFTSEGKKTDLQVELEMNRCMSRSGEYEIVEKSPVCFSFENVAKEKVRIKGTARLKFSAFCDRCLTEVPTVLELSFDRIVVSPEVAEDDEDVDDLSFMEGYQLDVETFVYNEIIENWPAKILCKEDCKGICPVCGQNRNIRDCGCDTFVPDPRMAVIQDIFNGNKEV